MKNKAPSQAETEALKILWDLGTATVSDLHQHITQKGEIAYTTVLKRVQRMEEKALIKRVSANGRAIVYAPVAEQRASRKSMVSKLINTVFDNSPNQLIQHAIGEHQLSREEISDIRALLDEIEKRDR